MSKSSRKSIVASFGLLSAELESSLAAAAAQKPEETTPAPTPVSRVGAGVIGAAHRAIDDIRAERDQLRAIVEAGGAAIKELDPELIDPSPYPDRLPDDDPAAFEAFKTSMETEGQKVPVQVRRHPSAPGRYQIVYGHRRWQAARALGRTVRAIEVEISDLDLVVAQGIENASRQDLTWIERALFAYRMDEAGIRPRDIYAALSIEDAELARMRSVYRAVPPDVIETIGRAPKIGRPRWLDLAKTLSADPGALDAARDALRQRHAGDTSDQRFQRTLKAVKPEIESKDDRAHVLAPAGEALAAWRISAKEVRVLAEGARGTAFLRYLEKQLPLLAEQFAREQDKEA